MTILIYSKSKSKVLAACNTILRLREDNIANNLWSG
jgi:hypothetical protein